MGFEDVFDLDLEVGPGASFAFGFYLDVEDVGKGGFNFDEVIWPTFSSWLRV